MDKPKTLVEELDRIAEIDWKQYGDVQKICVPAEKLVNDLNAAEGKGSANQPSMTVAKRVAAKLSTGGEVRLDEFIAEITAKPPDLLSANGKMGKTAEGKYLLYNIGLPAISGIVYDLERKRFYYVTTCTGAGTCLGLCYATRGNYVRFDPTWKKQTRILNYLLNDPDEFRERLKNEIIHECLVDPSAHVILRWHDAGDFFTKKYMEMAIQITAELNKKGYNFTSYAYSKVADFINMPKPDNFVTTLSIGAKDEEMKKLRNYKGKTSITVPRSMFNDIFKREGAHFKKDADGQYIFANRESKQILLDRIAANYNVPRESLIYDEDLKNQPKGNKFIYNAIVVPHNSDWAAIRQDVQHIFLLQH